MKWTLFKKKQVAEEDRRYDRKIDLGNQLSGFYGQHRSGWPFVLSFLQKLHNPDGIYLDTFIESTFCWGPQGKRANLEPWIGMIHVPSDIPNWFQYEQSNEYIFQTENWKKSLPFCRGLFTMSGFHKNALSPQFDFPINTLILPTETPELKWTWERFEANPEKKIIQIGWWLRKLHTIFLLHTNIYRKIFLKITHADLNSLLKAEREILIREGRYHEDIYSTAEEVKYIPDHQYDELLSENLVIVDLYKSNANNTVVECIVRNTPILINPIEPVIEYLGEGYPLYFSSLQEASEKAENFDLVYAAHQYLVHHPIKEKLAGDYFLKSFICSEIYQSI